MDWPRPVSLPKLDINCVNLLDPSAACSTSRELLDPCGYYVLSDGRGAYEQSLLMHLAYVDLQSPATYSAKLCRLVAGIDRVAGQMLNGFSAIRNCVFDGLVFCCPAYPLPGSERTPFSSSRSLSVLSVFVYRSFQAFILVRYKSFRCTHLAVPDNLSLNSQPTQPLPRQHEDLVVFRSRFHGTGCHRRHGRSHSSLRHEVSRTRRSSQPSQLAHRQLWRPDACFCQALGHGGSWS